MSTAPLAPTEAEDWAARMAEEHGLGSDAAALLTDLYVPGLPGLVEEFDREVAALPDRPEPLSWGVVRHKAATGLDHLLERLDDDWIRRLLVWSFAAGSSGGPRRQALPHHGHVRRHFGRQTPPWDTASLSLLLRTVGPACIQVKPVQRALATVDPSDRAPLAGELRAAADRLARWLRAHPAEERDREKIHHWLLLELLALGHAPASGEELRYRGDRYFDLLLETDPGLLSEPGVPALMVHHLQPFPGGVPWTEGLPPRLAEITDPADTARRFLEVALALPLPGTTPPRFTEEERERHGYTWNAAPRDAAHLSVHARHMLKGMAKVVAHLPRTSTPWAVDLLERLALRLESKPLRRQTTYYLAHDLSSVLSGLRAEEAFHAVARLRDQPDLDRGARKFHQAMVAQAARFLGWTPEQMVERSVPEHGLSADGTFTTRVGAFTVVLALTGDGTESTFTGPDGTAVRRAPKALRESHPDELKALQRRAAALRRALKAERERLAALAGSDRVWALPDWVPYYLAHPVTGPAAREVRWEAAVDGLAWRSCSVEADGGHWRLVGEEGATVLSTGRHAPDARIRPAGQVCG
ncbi:uncharacterized protein DUF4132 [Nocardiopsis sp. Huas11]|uniref:DUF4132 domain-containing protein n=1 Tax=Nocardiopsis sp. Huas11 TaxID=2183912 RepID=UPI000EB4A6D7|nr:DUF4132 domain-containing protein [Nocardiopsis sp. Huas11]RKS10743.1 uncharacterized protein DUF4132 [Nocardiopsis sp. Huas11]